MEEVRSKMEEVRRKMEDVRWLKVDVDKSVMELLVLENSSLARFASRSNRLSRLARPRTSNSNMIFFEQPPSPSPLKGLHLSLVFSPLRGKKTAPPVALTLR